MPTEGFKSITIREDDYWKLKELAARQRCSVPELIKKLLNDFEVHEI